MSNESKPQKGQYWTNNTTGELVEIVDVTSDSVQVRHPMGILEWCSLSTVLSVYSNTMSPVVSITKKAVSKNKVALPMEVFNDQPVNPEKAWKELKRACSN
jgi:hypothetical protein